MRSMLKTCLTLWADLHGAHEFQKPIYEQARQFVQHGSDALAQKICQLDHSPLGDSEALVQRFGRHFNLAMVASDAAGRVIGYFRLYNACSWRFVLCPVGGSASAIATYISNPQAPNVWTTDNLIPPEAVLGTVAAHDLDAARASFTRFYADYHQPAVDAEITKLCDNLADRLKACSGQVLTAEQLRDIASDEAGRIASWLLGLRTKNSSPPKRSRGLSMVSRPNKPGFSALPVTHFIVDIVVACAAQHDHAASASPIVLSTQVIVGLGGVGGSI